MIRVDIYNLINKWVETDHIPAIFKFQPNPAQPTATDTRIQTTMWSIWVMILSLKHIWYLKRVGVSSPDPTLTQP